MPLTDSEIVSFTQFYRIKMLRIIKSIKGSYLLADC